MASGFPGSIDSFTNPTSTSALNSPSHSGQHSDLNDAVNKVETYMGLVKVIPTSVTGSGVSLSANGTVTFSAASSIAINGCFGAGYDNYRILVTVTGNGGASTTQLRLRTGAGSDSTSVYVYGGWFIQYGATTLTAEGGTAATTFWRLGETGLSASSGSTAIVDIFQPNLAFATSYYTFHQDYAGYNRQHTGYTTSTTQFTGIEIYSAVTLTGTARVYGYRN